MPTTIRLCVRATPRAQSTDLRRLPDGSLAARVAAPRLDGRTNRALIDLLAETLDLRRRDVSIEGGTYARDKRIAVTTDNPSAVQAAISRLGAPG
ncbi:MAG: DUF167 domain-containing protein [Chloroflexi bacterium]|nr:DUF167 domain-containing protein [Chloroflexota bacterium]MCY3958789.1 DUF167 domain-containing protein [Chloroflexota bacterium]